MDSITHTVLGMLEGELIAGKKIGKKAMLFGAIANNLPDIDVATSFFVSVDKSLLQHRGFTHSILFAVLISITAAYLFHKKYPTLKFSACLMLWGFGLFSHLFLDSLTAYGTGWFEPCSHTRITFNTLFVADPFYTLPLIVSAIALLIKRPFKSGRTTWALVGLIPSFFYLSYTFYNKIVINKIAEKNFTKQKIKAKQYITTPTPLNNFLWFIIGQTDSGYYVGYYSVFDKTDTIPFSFIAGNYEMGNEFINDPAYNRLVRFSQGYYSLTKDSINNTSLHDLRFGLTDLFGKKKDFVFNYDLKKNGAQMVIQRGRMKAINSESFKKLIQRIKGI